MKILLGVPEYPPYDTGGGGEVFKNLALQYRKLGHEVVVLYGYYPTKHWNEGIKKFSDNDITFYQIPELPYPKSKPFLRTVMPPNWRAWRQLKKIIKNEKPDVAHLHGYGLIFVNLLANTVHRAAIPYIFTIHGYPEAQNKLGGLVNQTWQLYLRAFMHPTLRHAHKITGITDFVKNDKRNIRMANSVTIYNGINFDDFKHIQTTIDIPTKHHIDKGTRIIFSIGRISEMKGFQEVIMRLPNFLKHGKVKYLIAGRDDGYQAELEALIKKYDVEDIVEFIGFLSLEEKKQYIKNCDIFAIPSLWEPFGLVALEGMIYDRLILTTNYGGLKEVLSDYNKKVVLYDDDFVKQCHEKKDLHADFNRKKFSWPAIARQYLNLLVK